MISKVNVRWNVVRQKPTKVRYPPLTKFLFKSDVLEPLKRTDAMQGVIMTFSDHPLQISFVWYPYDCASGIHLRPPRAP